MAADGLTLRYRIGWKVRRLVMTVFGPAQLGDNDPIEVLHRERARKVAEAASAARTNATARRRPLR